MENMKNRKQVLFFYDHEDDHMEIVKLFNMDPNDPLVNGRTGQPDEDYIINLANQSGWIEVNQVDDANNFKVQKNIKKRCSTSATPMIAVAALNSGDTFRIFKKS